MTEQEPYLVVFFGILGYKIMSEHSTKAEAKIELDRVQHLARTEKLAVKGWTREASPHDFDIRVQSDLDALTSAILETY